MNTLPSPRKESEILTKISIVSPYTSHGLWELASEKSSPSDVYRMPRLPRPGPGRPVVSVKREPDRVSRRGAERSEFDYRSTAEAKEATTVQIAAHSPKRQKQYCDHRPRLEANSGLVVIPHRGLHKLPWPMLDCGAKPLRSYLAVSVLQNLSTVRPTYFPTTAKGVCFVGASQVGEAVINVDAQRSAIAEIYLPRN